MKTLYKSDITKLLKDSSNHVCYIGATVISATVHFLYSVYVKANIEPLEYGIYSTCILLQTFLMYLQCGSLNAFNRDYPQMIGANEEEKATICRNTVFTFLLVIFSIATVVVTVSAYFVRLIFYVDCKYSLGMILCAILTLTTIVENFLCSRVRIDGNFKYTSFVIIVELVSVGIGVYLIPLVGYYALYITPISAMLIGIILYYKCGLSDIRLQINKLMLWEMVLSGFPLLINNLIWTVVNSIDKFVILGFINVEALGIYSIAQMAFSYVMLIPNAMSQLFYVSMGKIYGSTGSKQLLIESGVKYTLVLAVSVGLITICAFYLIEFLVDKIMPNYSSGIKSAQILMVALVLYAPTTVNSNILTILKENAALLRSSIYLLIFNIFFSVTFVLLNGVNIENVALGTAISYFIRTIILIFQLKKYAEVPAHDMMEVSVIPVLVIVGPAVILYWLIDSKMVSFILAFLIALLLVVFVYGKKIKDMFYGNV